MKKTGNKKRNVRKAAALLLAVVTTMASLDLSVISTYATEGETSAGTAGDVTTTAGAASGSSVTSESAVTSPAAVQAQAASQSAVDPQTVVDVPAVASVDGDTVKDISGLSGVTVISEADKDDWEGKTLTGTTNSASARLEFSGGTWNLTFKDLNMSCGSSYSPDAAAYPNVLFAPISLKDGATLNLTLEGTNSLKGCGAGAGLSVAEGCTLCITADSTGSLTATGGKGFGGAAGIGANAWGYGANEDDAGAVKVGTIEISGGTVTATGGTHSENLKAVYGAAGIGGSGWEENTGTIEISGGTVAATGGAGAAGIGGGSYNTEVDAHGGRVSVIRITGGTVHAAAGQDYMGYAGAAIGNGVDTAYDSENDRSHWLSCPEIRITGGTVETQGDIGYGDLKKRTGGRPEVTGSAYVTVSGADTTVDVGADGVIAPVQNDSVSRICLVYHYTLALRIPEIDTTETALTGTVTLGSGDSACTDTVSFAVSEGTASGTFTVAKKGLYGEQPVTVSLNGRIYGSTVNLDLSKEIDFSWRAGLSVDMTTGSYVYHNGVLLLNSGSYTVTMAEGETATSDRIRIAEGAEVMLTLSGVTIDSTEKKEAALGMSGSSAKLTLNVSGENALRTDIRNSGPVDVHGCGSLVIQGDGSLELKNILKYNEGGYYDHCLGISARGTALVIGGTVQLTVDLSAASNSVGIYGDNVTINGGRVTAKTGSEGHGIGLYHLGGWDTTLTWHCGTVVINGGTVYASGGKNDPNLSGITNNYTGWQVNGGSVNMVGEYTGQSTYGYGLDTATNTADTSLNCYCTTITGLPQNAAVTELDIKDSEGQKYAYGTDQMYTDASGALYLWLPENAVVSCVTAGGYKYYGTCTTNATMGTKGYNNHLWGTATAAFAPKKQLCVSETPVLSVKYGEALNTASVTESGSVVIYDMDTASATETTVAGTWAVTESDQTVIPTADAAYELTFTPSEDPDSYEPLTVKVSPTFTKRTLLLQMADLSITYGDTLPQQPVSGDITVQTDGSYDGLASGDTVAAVVSSLTLHFPEDIGAKPDAGSYAFTVTSDSAYYDITFQYGTENAVSGTLTVGQATWSGGTPTISRQYVRTAAHTDTVELNDSAYLPADAGTVSCEISTGSTADTYFSQSEITGTTLSYTTKVFDAVTTGTLKLTVSSQNYVPYDIELTLSFVDQLPVACQSAPTLGSQTLTYGQPLSSLTLTQGVFVDASDPTKELTGTLHWVTPDQKPEAGASVDADYTFVPSDTDYQTYNGKVQITVAKAQPSFTAPSLAGLAYAAGGYDSAMLNQMGAGYTLTAGSVTGADGTSLTGTWCWGSSTAPVTTLCLDAGMHAQQIYFALNASDAANYELPHSAITLDIAKATPNITAAAAQGAYTHGEYLYANALSGTADTAGTFAWQAPQTKLSYSAGASQSFGYIFTPTDTKNFEIYTGMAEVTVQQLQNAPNMPADAILAASTALTVSDISLPTGWEWASGDAGTAIPAAGGSVTAEAVYTAADRACYVTTCVTVTITASACAHEQTELRNAREATCHTAGYTGDTWCTVCNTCIMGGTTTACDPDHHEALTATVTTPATTTAEGVRTCHCSACGAEYTEVIEKVTGGSSTGGSSGGSGSTGGSSGGGSSAGSGGAQTPDQSGDAATEKEPQIKGADGISGWTLIQNEIQRAVSGETLTITMNGARTVPAGVLNSLKGRNVTVRYELAGGITLTLNGRELSGLRFRKNTDYSVVLLWSLTRVPTFVRRIG